MQAFVVGTKKCNLQCPFCIERDNTTAFELNKVLDTVAGLLAREDDHHVVRISGGEPLSDQAYIDGLMEIIAPYKDKTDIILFTNAQLLTRSIHLKLLASCRHLLYIVGISPVPYKSLELFINNKDAMSIFAEDRTKFQINYIIDDEAHLPVFVKDAGIMSSMGLRYKLGYNKHNTQHLSQVYSQLKAAVSQTGYVPPSKNLFAYECSTVNIMPDGTMQTCKSGWSEKQKAFAGSFKKNICAACRYKNHCNNCVPMLIKFRFEACYLTKAIGVNLDREDNDAEIYAQIKNSPGGCNRRQS